MYLEGAGGYPPQRGIAILGGWGGHQWGWSWHDRPPPATRRPPPARRPAWYWLLTTDY